MIDSISTNRKEQYFRIFDAKPFKHFKSSLKTFSTN